MLHAEKLDSWNEIFPDCKIREVDLRSPTEAFLTRILTAYLKLLGYKVPNMDYEDNSPEKRLFQVKLTRHIDHILKISKKTYTFSYFDLLQPTTKKTSHMIQILLNYLYYYNMYKSECFIKANEHIHKYENLVESIRKIQEDIELSKKKDKELKAELKELAEKKVKLNRQSDEQLLKNEKQKEHKQKLMQDINELSEQVQNLEPLKLKLQKEIVSDDEARNLQSKVEQLQKDLAEQKRIETEITNNRVLHDATIKTARELIASLKEAKTILPPKLLEDFKEAREQVKASKAAASQLAEKKQQLLKVIEKHGLELKQLIEKEKHVKEQHETEKASKLQVVENVQKCHKNASIRLQALKDEEHSLECLLCEENETKEFIDESIHEIMAVYRKAS